MQVNKPGDFPNNSLPPPSANDSHLSNKESSPSEETLVAVSQIATTATAPLPLPTDPRALQLFELELQLRLAKPAITKSEIVQELYRNLKSLDQESANYIKTKFEDMLNEYITNSLTGYFIDNKFLSFFEKTKLPTTTTIIINALYNNVNREVNNFFTNESLLCQELNDILSICTLSYSARILKIEAHLKKSVDSTLTTAIKKVEDQLSMPWSLSEGINDWFVGFDLSPRTTLMLNALNESIKEEAETSIDRDALVQKLKSLLSIIAFPTRRAKILNFSQYLRNCVNPDTANKIRQRIEDIIHPDGSPILNKSTFQEIELDEATKFLLNDLTALIEIESQKYVRWIDIQEMCQELRDTLAILTPEENWDKKVLMLKTNLNSIKPTVANQIRTRFQEKIGQVWNLGKGIDNWFDGIEVPEKTMFFLTDFSNAIKSALKRSDPSTLLQELQDCLSILSKDKN